MERPTIDDVDWHVILRYEEGRLYWRHRRNSWILPGREAGCLHSNGYRRIAITLSGVAHRYYSHQIVLAMHGHRVEGYEIDHVNGVRDDNRIENLRVVSSSINKRNAKKRSWSSSRYFGVSFIPSDGRWRMCLYSQGKRVAQSRYRHALDAALAYDRAKNDLLIDIGEDPTSFKRSFNFPESLQLANRPAGSEEQP